jgi:hypothetical protein
MMRACSIRGCPLVGTLTLGDFPRPASPFQRVSFRRAIPVGRDRCLIVYGSRTRITTIAETPPSKEDSDLGMSPKLRDGNFAKIGTEVEFK